MFQNCHISSYFLVQNFADIGQSVDELWPKKSDFQDGGRRRLEFQKFQFYDSAYGV